MPRPDPRRNITRVQPPGHEGPARWGWLVRVQRRGRLTSRFFGDSRHGGKRGALQAAKAFRDAAEEQADPWDAQERAAMPSVRNRTGLVGVHRRIQTVRRGDYEFSYACWVAQWIDGHGHRRTRSFSVTSLGERAARAAAIAAREEGILQSGR